MSSKLSKSSSVTEHSNNKATPKAVNRISRATPKSDGPADLVSPLKNSRLSVDRSTRSPLNSKPTPIDRRSPKLTTPPDKQQTRVPKAPELQAQLSLVQDDLKNANEKLNLIEKEKAKAVEELKDAQRCADKANEKLREAQAAQKQAEENSEIEKFRAVEMEQAAIETNNNKEEQWRREIEALRNQHALDIAELQKLKQELIVNLDEKNKAVIYAENVESLSAEVAQLKGLLNAKLESEAHVNTRLVSELEAMKEELEKAKVYEEKLVEKEARVEELNAELEAAKLAEMSSFKSISAFDLEIETLKQELEKERSYKQKLLEKAARIDELSAELEFAKLAETSAHKSMSELDLEINNLKQELEDAKCYKQKLAEEEACIEQLNSELEDAKLAEISAKKSMEELQKKVTDLEALDGESTQLVSELDLEIHNLKQELEDAKGYKQRLVEKEVCIEKLNFELEAAKLAEISAKKLREEWQKKVKGLEARAEESNRLERSASESLESVMKQLEKSNDSFHDAESEIALLREKVGLLEISIARQKGELEESEHQLAMAKEKAAEMTKKAELVEYELENVEEEKNQALNNEKLAAESVQSLLEEKNKIINELENLRDEDKKNKKEIENLTTSLQEASSQAKEAKERLSFTQTEQENYENQIENLRLVLNATNEKYQSMLDEAKHEIETLTDTIEQNKQGYENSRTEWEQKEEELMNSVKNSEDENSSLEKEISKLTNLLKEAEEAARLNETDSDVISLKEIIGETKAESMKLKEILLKKENELQSVIEENNEIRKKEAISNEKIEELEKLLDEAMAEKHEVVNGELSENEIEYDLSAKVVECYKENGHGKEEDKPKVEVDVENLRGDVNVVEVDVENLNENQKDYENEEKEEESKEVDVKMWEIFQFSEKELSQVKKQEECLEEEFDPKVDSEEKFEQVNELSSTENGGNISPLIQHQKKKKPLLQKFGSLLKKKGTTNHQ